MCADVPAVPVDVAVAAGAAGNVPLACASGGASENASSAAIYSR